MSDNKFNEKFDKNNLKNIDKSINELDNVVKDIKGSEIANIDGFENIMKATELMSDLFKHQIDCLNGMANIIENANVTDENGNTIDKDGNIVVSKTMKSEEYDFSKDEYEFEFKLKDILKERKLSQTWLCKKTGITTSTMSYIIKNGTSISGENLIKISMVLGVSANKILVPIKKS